MIFRIRKRNTAYTNTKIKSSIPSDSFVILDKTYDAGYRLGSNSSYWASKEKDKHGDLEYVLDLMDKIQAAMELDIVDPTFDEMSEEDRNIFIEQRISAQGFFVEAGDEQTEKWFIYQIYDDLNQIDDI